MGVGTQIGSIALISPIIQAAKLPKLTPGGALSFLNHEKTSKISSTMGPDLSQ